MDATMLKREYLGMLDRLNGSGVRFHVERCTCGLGLFEIRITRGQTAHVKTSGGWERDDGRTGAGPASLVRLLLSERAGEIRRHAVDGSDRTVMLDTLQSLDCDAVAITRMVRTRGGGWDVEYRDARNRFRTSHVSCRNPRRACVRWADRLEDRMPE